jgi:pimeloyl-ACP methyl ester carboxylesterase
VADVQLPRPVPGPRVRSADGVELATWDLGGDGPPMLCTHGTGLHAWMWLAAAPALGRRHRVWSLDLRGHGASDPSPDRTYDRWSAFAGDVLAAVEALRLERPVAVGHSLGSTALLLAEQAAPGTFAGLWCYEPIVPPPGQPPSAPGRPSLADLTRRRRGRFDSRQAAVAHFRPKPPFAAFAPGVLEAYVDHATRPAPDGGVTLVLPGPEEATCYEGAISHGAWDHLGELDLPVTVAGAGAGDVGPSAWVDDIAGRIRDARTERFDGLSHFGPMEDPGRVGAAASAALAGGSTAAVAPPR